MPTSPRSSLGCNAKELQIRTAEKCGLFSSLFYGQGVYLQTVQNYHKKLPRLSGIIRVHSGRTERTSPHNLRKVLPAKAHAGTFPCGCGRSSGAQQAHKKTVSRFYARQQPERRTDYQIPPDQAAMFRGSYTAGSVAFLLLSTTLPAFCLRISP